MRKNVILEDALRKQFPERAEELIKKVRANIVSANYEKIENESEALIGGFIWVDSPEGYNYWNEIYSKLYKE